MMKPQYLHAFLKRFDLIPDSVMAELSEKASLSLDRIWNHEQFSVDAYIEAMRVFFCLSDPRDILDQIDLQASLSLIPFELITKYKALPVVMRSGNKAILFSEYYCTECEELFSQLIQGYSSGYLTSWAEIQSILEEEGTQQRLADLGRAFRRPSDARSARLALDIMNSPSEAQSVEDYINAVILDAIQSKASDIHIESAAQSVVVKYRIDGVLQTMEQDISPDFQKEISSRIKVMASLDVVEHRVPQDGVFRLRLYNRDVDFRVSVVPSIYGESLVIRILDKSLISGLQSLSLDVLGFEPGTLERFRQAINKPYGMVLVAGPTGGGKTTSLYAALNHLNTGESKIVTLEDPVEYDLPGVLQLQVSEKQGFTFSQGLRAILRHDPDKILVGEIRDADTAQTAVQLALTGHLVLSTLHANRATDVLIRMSHLGINIADLVASVHCIVAQRLIRLACTHCVQKNDDGLIVQTPGCKKCGNSGFQGRVAVAECIEITPELKSMILEGARFEDFERYFQVSGISTLIEAAHQLYVSGQTSLQEVNRVAS